jgi:two-component system cell cycle response regulator
MFMGDRILVVEDDPAQAAQLRSVLGVYGYQVSVATDGKEAPAIIGENEPAPSPQQSFEFGKGGKTMEPAHEVAYILVIEDSPTQARQIRLILESANYRVAVATTGSQGLAMSQEIPPDLVILDVILPDLDGFSVCQQLQQQLSNYVAVLMLTVRGSVTDRVNGLEMGADDYLPKPFDARELLARVKALLRTKSLHDELRRRLEQEYRSHREWRQAAITDHLTGVYNRHYLAEVLEREFSRVQRHNTPLACIMADVDQFRAFNTRHGHVIGDWVLKGVARILKESVRQTDLVARYGGDEFIVLLPMSNITAAVKTAARLSKFVAAQVWESPVGPLQVTISLGVAALPDVGVTEAKELVTCADHALYQAKEQGGNRVVVFQPAGSETSCQ